ncbi:hypothetical protein CgunFtcFv8_006582 [Champsocephalus gunnari]|uniref:Uncharacterized protein n=1 Tax=Champsocephalus gunnari TaxID=52237 RepID=A0AAN8GZG2_CHAGU|nr:hypothetical protein CgunFtcFv8_006582 [Champsocephalus gunnari]
MRDRVAKDDGEGSLGPQGSLGPRGRRRRRARSDGGLRTKGRVARTPRAAEGRCGELAGLCVTGWRRRVARTRRARRDGGRGAED